MNLNDAMSLASKVSFWPLPGSGTDGPHRTRAGALVKEAPSGIHFLRRGTLNPKPWCYGESERVLVWGETFGFRGFRQGP